jgi:N-acetylmuramoyl-L-alanine amidase-like protein
MAFIASPNFWMGNNTHEKIVIHQWNDRDKHPVLEGVLNWFLNPDSQLSAHWLESDDKEIQMVRESDRAWHAMQANGFAIGIECDPNGGDPMYTRIINRCFVICKSYGLTEKDIVPHNQYVQTECPRWIDLNRIRKGVKAKLEGKEEDMVQDNKEDFLLTQRLFTQITQRPAPLSKSEFDKQHFVGKSWKVVIDTFLKNGLAKQVSDDARLGQKARVDKWRDQILTNKQKAEDLEKSLNEWTGVPDKIVEKVAGDLSKLIVGKK